MGYLKKWAQGKKLIKTKNKNMPVKRKVKEIEDVDIESDYEEPVKKKRKSTKKPRPPVSTEDKEAKKQREKDVKEATAENKKNGRRGTVVCNKLPHRFDKTLVDKKWPVVKGYKNINVCSAAPGAYKFLSPMKLGPIKYNLEDDKRGETGVVKIKNLENCWQYSKVWEGEVDENNLPKEEFWTRRKDGWEDEKGHRWVKPKFDHNGNRNVTLFNYWKAERLGYQEAREKVYCPLYAELVQKTDVYKKLKKLVDEGCNIQILGYDGYDYSDRTLMDCFLDTSKPFGHEHVLCGLLNEDHVWEK